MRFEWKHKATASEFEYVPYYSISLVLFAVYNVLYFDIKDLRSVKAFCIVLIKD